MIKILLIENMFGQSIPANAYVNPFFFKNSERENSKIKSKMNNVPLNSGPNEYNKYLHININIITHCGIPIVILMKFI